MDAESQERERIRYAGARFAEGLAALMQSMEPARGCREDSSCGSADVESITFYVDRDGDTWWPSGGDGMYASHPPGGSNPCPLAGIAEWHGPLRKARLIEDGGHETTAGRSSRLA